MSRPTRKARKRKRKPGERWAIATFAVNAARLAIELFTL